MFGCLQISPYTLTLVSRLAGVHRIDKTVHKWTLHEFSSRVGPSNLSHDHRLRFLERNS